MDGGLRTSCTCYRRISRAWEKSVDRLCCPGRPDTYRIGGKRVLIGQRCLYKPAAKDDVTVVADNRLSRGNSSYRVRKFGFCEMRCCIAATAIWGVGFV